MKIKQFFGSILFLLVLVAVAYAGLNDRFSKIDLTEDNKIRIPQIGAPAGNPQTDKGWVYVKAKGTSTGLYFENDGGTVADLLSPKTNIPLASLFVDSVGPITAASAPNLTTVDNVGKVVYDTSGETAEIQFTYFPTANFTGMQIGVTATSSVAAGSEQALDWSVFVYDEGSAIPSAVAQTGAAFTEVSMDTVADKLTLTLDATGIAAITAGTSRVVVALFNNGTSNGTLEIASIDVTEL